jgi:hypothetical protein
VKPPPPPPGDQDDAPALKEKEDAPALSLKEDLEGLASTKEKGIQMMAYTKGFTTAYRRPHLLGPPMSPTSLKTAEIRQSGRSKIEDRLLRLTAL